MSKRNPEITEAQLLAYADDFWLLAVMFAAMTVLLPFMRRIRLERPAAGAAAKERATAPPIEEGAV